MPPSPADIAEQKVRAYAAALLANGFERIPARDTSNGEYYWRPGQHVMLFNDGKLHNKWGQSEPFHRSTLEDILAIW